MSKTKFEIKTTKAGERIAVARGSVVGCDEHTNKEGEVTSYRLNIRLEGGERCVGFRGLSLGTVPVAVPNSEGQYPNEDSFYIKEADMEYGNTAWNLGFAPIDDFNPFED